MTLGPTFEDAGTEVNVFTPAIIIDLVDPVASETGLTDVLASGRDYLRRQIEGTGLVRYHGDPGPVPPAVRGCELPPDADDTALVWRIARPDRSLLAAARREIERYRDGDGLYRTWLADDDGVPVLLHPLRGARVESARRRRGDARLPVPRGARPGRRRTALPRASPSGG